MNEIHTIASDLPADACHWPACANPVCERSENGTCPLNGVTIVECKSCGAPIALGRDCPYCLAPTGVADGAPTPQGIVTGSAHETPRYWIPDDPTFAPRPTPRTHKRSVRSVLIVNDDARVIRHSELRALLELAGDTRTLGEAIGVHQSTISRALAGSSPEPLSRDERIRAVRLLIGTEDGS